MDAERWRRISILYHQALALTTEERSVFLASACGDDAGLRQELESLLADDTPVDDRLPLAASETFAEPVSPTAEGVNTVARPGTILGSYRIERLLGHGGMATVFLAQDLKHRRTVAIKILKTEIGAAVGNRRFLREIEIAAQLVHPHILPLFDSGAVGDQLYYVMPHVEGGSLRSRLQRERLLPVDEALRLAREIASALGHSHRQGFIHRDIKPENILLSDGIALVADFGIARLMSASGGEALTGSWTVLGTPRYMSPEQALGTGSVGAPSDLYSLACVLYEMLAGQPPFTAPGVMTVLSQHAGQLVPPLREKRPEIPEGIERAIERALAKTPDDRYPTAAHFVEALTAGTIGTPIPASSTSQDIDIPHNLPPQRTSFVGRERELTECVKLLHETRLLTLTGIGGCGKTRLALKLAEGLLGSYPDGVWFADLAPLSDGSGVPETVALVLGVRGGSGNDVTETLCRHVEDRRALLVLDNCEHLLESSGQLVDALLNGGDQLRILITSREGLGIDGERQFAVRSLPVPVQESGCNLQAVEASAAVQLFVDRARVVDPAFTLTELNASAVADVCRRLDGIPLAIELAAARVKVLSVEEILSKLDDRFRLLTGGKKALPRHQTLWSVFEWSYDHLTADERRLFRLLSVFAGGWTLAAATAVSSQTSDEFEVLELLTHLVSKSLVVVERVATDRVRYRLLETSRQFAQQKLNDLGEGEAERTRHLEYFITWAEAREELAVGPQRGKWLLDIESEHQNVLAALDWCDGAARGAEAVRLVAAVWRYWPTRGLSTLGRGRLTQALKREGPEAPTPARAKALLGAGRLALRQGGLVEGRVLLEESLAICRRFDDRTGMARALNNLGLAYNQEGDDVSARVRFEESLALAREAGDRRGASMSLNNLAELLRERDDLTAARPLYEQALAEARIGGDRGNVALCLHNLALLRLQNGDTEGAASCNLEALHIVRDLGLRALGVGVIEITAGVAARASGSLALGARLGGASQALFQAMGITREGVNERMRAHLIASVRPMLGEQAFAQATAEGAALSYEAALKEARFLLETRDVPATNA